MNYETNQITEPTPRFTIRRVSLDLLKEYAANEIWAHVRENANSLNADAHCRVIRKQLSKVTDELERRVKDEIANVNVLKDERKALNKQVSALKKELNQLREATECDTSSES